MGQLGCLAVRALELFKGGEMRSKALIEKAIAELK